jgi:hypothetical protein
MNEATNGFSRVVEYKGCAIDPHFNSGFLGSSDGRARERGTIGFRLSPSAPRLSSKLSESSTRRRGGGTANTTSLATWSTRIRERSSIYGVRIGIRRTGNEAEGDRAGVGFAGYLRLLG